VGPGRDAGSEYDLVSGLRALCLDQVLLSGARGQRCGTVGLLQPGQCDHAGCDPDANRNGYTDVDTDPGSSIRDADADGNTDFDAHDDSDAGTADRDADADSNFDADVATGVESDLDTDAGAADCHTNADFDTDAGAADFDTDAYTDAGPADRDADAYTDAGPADRDTDAHADAATDSDTDTDTDAYGDAGATDVDTDAYADAATDSDSDTDAYDDAGTADFNAYADPHVGASHCDVDAHSDTDADAAIDRDSHAAATDGHAHADANTGRPARLVDGFWWQRFIPGEARRNGGGWRGCVGSPGLPFGNCEFRRCDADERRSGRHLSGQGLLEREFALGEAVGGHG
jgi:hypothetical protein